jgi:glycogen debranching enzyme
VYETQALQVAAGLLEASDAWNGRLPELFSGLDRTDVGTPVPFPTSCSPQAWSAATPFLLLRTMLGLEPHPTQGLSIDPIEGAVEDDLVLLGLRRLDRRFDVRVNDGKTSVQAWMDNREP